MTETKYLHLVSGMFKLWPLCIINYIVIKGAIYFFSFVFEFTQVYVEICKLCISQPKHVVIPESGKILKLLLRIS